MLVELYAAIYTILYPHYGAWSLESLLQPTTGKIWNLGELLALQ
jgi:hypothetical protein